MTGRDDVAIDVSGPVRFQVSGHDVDQRFVQQRHAVGHRTLLDQRTALGHHRGGNQVRVLVTQPVRTKSHRGRDHRGEVIRLETGLHLNVSGQGGLQAVLVFGEYVAQRLQVVGRQGLRRGYEQLPCAGPVAT